MYKMETLFEFKFCHRIFFNCSKFFLINNVDSFIFLSFLTHFHIKKNLRTNEKYLQKKETVKTSVLIVLYVVLFFLLNQ